MQSRAVKLVASLAILAGCMFSSEAHADVCSATLSNVNFGSFSSLTGSDITASATGTITCSWTLLSPTPPFVLLLPKVLVCLHFGVGTNSTSTYPRTLGNSGQRLAYNLYRSPAYSAANILGTPGIAATPTPMSTILAAPNLITGGTLTQNFTVYGHIPSDAALSQLATVNNGPTTFSSSFAAGASVSYAFFNLLQPSCSSGTTSALPFNVSATLINDCQVTAQPINFGSQGILYRDTVAVGGLSVRCVNNTAYRISLNGGSVASNVRGRQMAAANGTRISYRLSATDGGAVWGDGTGGTTTVTGVGTGTTQSIPIYAKVPAQTTPAPGDYRDTVTAVIYF